MGSYLAGVFELVLKVYPPIHRVSGRGKRGKRKRKKERREN
jgi:hypothetical protein